jgi:hypothetical protein
MRRKKHEKLEMGWELFLGRTRKCKMEAAASGNVSVY